MSVAVPTFPFLRELVLTRSGVLLSDEQEYLLEARLAPLARELGFDSASEVVEAVRRNGDKALSSRVVEAMVTGETSWFRDLHPFDALRTVVLPELVEARRPHKSLSVWSAACSTGQEIYSIAMMLDTFFPETAEWQLKLVGTDLSATAVARARDGVFTHLEINRGLPVMMLTHYFVQEGAKFRIADSIRHKVRFDTLNLVSDWLPPSTFDIVLLRNVLIYFDVPVKKQVLAGVWSKVTHGGFLFLGATETALGLGDDLVPTHRDGVTYYKKGTH